MQKHFQMIIIIFQMLDTVLGQRFLGELCAMNVCSVVFLL